MSEQEERDAELAAIGLMVEMLSKHGVVMIERDGPVFRARLNDGTPSGATWYEDASLRDALTHLALAAGKPQP